MANRVATTSPSRAGKRPIAWLTTPPLRQALCQLASRCAHAADCHPSDWLLCTRIAPETAALISGHQPDVTDTTPLAHLPTSLQRAVQANMPTVCTAPVGWPWPHPPGTACLVLPLQRERTPDTCLVLGEAALGLPQALAAARLLWQQPTSPQESQCHLEWLAAAVAHEVRNPLSAIKGATQYLEGKLDDHLSRRFLTIISQEADRLTRFTTNFLTYARPSQPTLGAFDLNRLALATWELLAPEAHKRGVSACFRLHRPLPPAFGDAEALKQAVMNLLLNAMQAMPQGGEITVRTQRRGHWLALGVRDQGEGIPPQALHRIFEPFFSTKRQGSGLGLPIVKRIVEQHRGRVSVSSRPGQGTLVTLHLPVLRPLRPAACEES